MPCNPAVGGTAKGHLVREIDALGGLMAEAIDATGLQFKLLNRSRGPAVWSPRAQADKRRYSEWMRTRLGLESRIHWITAAVGSLLLRGDRIQGVALEDGTALHAQAVVVTTGTFLNGLIHVGANRTPAGRLGEAPARALATSLKSMGLKWGRLKTGTPPRLHRGSVDFSALQEERGDDPAVPFSFLNDAIARPQIVCHLLHTTERVHDLVRSHIAGSPLYNGQITGIGPRYCPSLEDKVMRFPDRERHQIFLEPEGLDVDEIYVNGCSMSLAPDVQLLVVQALPGLAQAEMLRPGYAVEYDFVQPTELRRTLETRAVKGLFLAGQINGTSGYEEAAGQGILVGINAALMVRGRAPLIIRRDEAYIGVMVDDLTTQGCLEPYRMFTSRAEHRLILRADNADARLTPIGRRLGLIDDHRWQRFEQRQMRRQALRGVLDEVLVATPDGHRVPASQLLRRPEVRLAELFARGNLTRAEGTDPLEELSVETDIKYEGYLRRQSAEVARTRRAEHRRLPSTLRYDSVPGLSREVRDRLTQIAPETLGQAARVPGVTPAAVAILARFLERGLLEQGSTAEA
jgi:tRNA uridine 5-carboxymethylaminomethyl modification enzyme